MKKGKNTLQNIGICLLAACVPALLAVAGAEARRYGNLEKEVDDLQAEQYEIIEDNRRFVSNIGALSSSERFEDIAVSQYGLRPAKSEEYVRVKVENN